MLNITFKMNKEMVKTINEIAQVNFEKAISMVEGINLVLGTNYSFLNKRVAFLDENCKAHDAYTYAEN
ncbi:MAG: hypothetical protein HP057_01065 [Erysipelatoclostridium sp.]|nr:hypothetical protein [Thomasclavelia sp.]